MSASSNLFSREEVLRRLHQSYLQACLSIRCFYKLLYYSGSKEFKIVHLISVYYSNETEL